MQTTVFYATNRAHEGPERFKPLRYGTRFSSDGMENLRFGRVAFDADDAQVRALLSRQKNFTGAGDGEALQDYFAQCARNSQLIEAYEESIPDKAVADSRNTNDFTVATYNDNGRGLAYSYGTILNNHIGELAVSPSASATGTTTLSGP